MSAPPPEMNRNPYATSWAGPRENQQKAVNAEFNKTSRAAAASAKSFAQMETVSKGMDKSFQGMQAKAGVAQKIVGTIMDTFAVGVSKTQKEFVGALKKGFQEGDFAAMVDSLVNMRFQFADLTSLAKPWIEAFKPFTIMMQVIGTQAAGIVATSTEFQNFIQWMATPEGMAAMRVQAQQLADVVLKLVSMDWTTTLNLVTKIIDAIERFVDFAKGAVDYAKGGGFFGWMGRGFQAAPDASPVSTPPPSTASLSVSAGGVMSESMFRRLVNAIRTRTAMV